MQRELLDDGHVHLGLEVTERIATGGLCLVHRDIGVAQELIDRGRFSRDCPPSCDGDPDAALDGGLSAVHRQGGADGLEQLDHDLRDAPLVRDVLKQNRELVAAKPGNGIAHPQRQN